MAVVQRQLWRAVVLAAIVILVSGCWGSSTPSSPIPSTAPGVGAEGAPADPANHSVGDIGPGDQDTPLAAPEEGDLPAFESTPPLVGRLVLGESDLPVETRVGADGGTVSIVGLELVIPDGALAADTDFTVDTVAASGVSAGGWGGALTPLTPLYSIDNGGVPLSAPVTVILEAMLPADAAAGTTAMAFFYDRDSGALSPLAPVDWDGIAVTALATHFSDIIGMAVDWSRVPAVVDSGFRPGIDDWAFNNSGSYAAPGGQCEGQTLSEIWYFGQQRGAAGAPPLNGRYDNNGASPATPGLWQDDSDAYRMVASVHADPIIDLTLYQQLLAEQWDAIENRPTWDAFRAAIALSGQPQMIRVSTDGVSGGHTMVVYRVNRSRLYVADPNYVGQLRTIAWDAEAEDLAPYRSGRSARSIAADGGVEYSHFAYVPVAAARTDAAIAARWAELEAGSAGDTLFPSYRLEASEGEDADGRPIWVPLTDGFRTDQATLSIQLPYLDNGADVAMALYRDAQRVPGSIWDWQQVVALDPGDNEIGLSIYARIDGELEYVDFVRLTITRAELGASPTPGTVAGRWVLAESRRDPPAPPHSPTPVTGQASEFSISDGSFTAVHRQTGMFHYSATAIATWDPPPASAVPGDTWTSTMAVRGTCEFDVEPRWEMRIGATLIADGADNAEQILEDAATCAEGGTSIELSLTFPQPLDRRSVYGDTPVLIYLGGGDSHSRGAWVYKYRWQP